MVSPGSNRHNAPLLLIGASAEALSLCRLAGYNVVGVSDPRFKNAYGWHNLPTFEDDRDAVAKNLGTKAAVAIDEPGIRRRAFNKLEELGVEVVSLVAGRLGSDVVAGDGLFVQELCNLSEGSRVGKGLRLNIGANVMHDATIGDFVTIAPNATILGRVTIGNDTYIGAGAIVLPELTVGNCVLIGAGAVVTRSVPDNAVWKGVPAR